MAKELLLIGGGHAHLFTLANIPQLREKGYQVTVVQPSPWHYYSGMGPGMLGGSYQPEEIRFATRRQVEAGGGKFVLGMVERIDPVARRVSLAGSGEELPYDVLSCNVGSAVRRQIIAGEYDSVFTAKPIEQLLTAREKVAALAGQRRCRIAVVGGGPSALEIAGNLHQLCRTRGRNLPEIRLYAGRSLLPGRAERLRFLAREILQKKAIRIIDGIYVVRIEEHRLLLDNGVSVEADLIFVATGVAPPPLFTRSGLPVGHDGGLLVNAALQSTAYPEIFGGGDCISFQPRPLDKVGVYAVRQNRVLFNNLLAWLDGTPLTPFSPGGEYLLIYNLGDGDGLLAKWWLTFAGKAAFRLKDWIDRRFMATFAEPAPSQTFRS
jgi:NADH dehydrogenase FAD-containing subunit